MSFHEVTILNVVLPAATYQKSPVDWSRSVQVHWFSILNSLMVVLVMSSIVAMIMMRTIRRDLARYEGLLGDPSEPLAPPFLAVAWLSGKPV